LLIAAAYFLTSISHTLVFWVAFIRTRPLGATLGDLLTKPVADGGLQLSRITSSLVTRLGQLLRWSANPVATRNVGRNTTLDRAAISVRGNG
jgi:uncharacterized membrane-anchored protein